MGEDCGPGSRKIGGRSQAPLRASSGRCPLDRVWLHGDPCYNSSSNGLTSHGGDGASGKKGSSNSGHHTNDESNHGGKASKSDQERRKGIAWTENEHRSNTGSSGMSGKRLESEVIESYCEFLKL